MEATEVRQIVNESLQEFKLELVQTIRQEVVLKVREEVKNEIIVNVVNEIRRNGDLLEQMHEYQKVSDLQTHNLLSNIAEILNRKLKE